MTQLFDRVVVISLRRRHERLAAFYKSLCDGGWVAEEPTLFDAVDGGSGTVPCPSYWKSGGGAYGCQQSHIQVLQRALMDGVKSLLVFEDDAVFQSDFTATLHRFMEAVPVNWECLMLGGQHMSNPVPVSDGIVRCTNTQRTHAYAVYGNAIRDLCQMWQGSRNHIDWDMGPFFGKRGKTYAPDPFMVGQGAGRSDISGRNNPAKFWRPPQGDSPVLWLRCPREVAEELRNYGFHYGYDRDHEGNDRGLNEIFPKPGRYAGGIGKFVTDVQWECASFPEGDGICTIWHPYASAMCAHALLSDVAAVQIDASTTEEALAKCRRAFGEKFVFLRTPDA